MNIWLAWLSPLACTPETEDCADETPAIQVGTGVAELELLDKGDAVVMVFGPQGGWHIDVAARVTGLGPDVQVRPTVSTLDGVMLAGDQASSFVALANYDEQTCVGDVLGVRAFLDDASLPDGVDSYADFICSLVGTPLELTVAIDNFGEKSVTDTLEVTAEAGPYLDCTP